MYILNIFNKIYPYYVIIVPGIEPLKGTWQIWAIKKSHNLNIQKYIQFEVLQKLPFHSFQFGIS